MNSQTLKKRIKHFKTYIHSQALDIFFWVATFTLSWKALATE